MLWFRFVSDLGTSNGFNSEMNIQYIQSFHVEQIEFLVSIGNMSNII